MRKPLVGLVWVASFALLVGCSSDPATDVSGGEYDLDTAQPTSVVDSGFGVVEVTGAALPLLEDPTTDPAVGTPAPAVDGLGPDGSTVSLTPGGTPKVALFVAHWCPHCQAEIPVLVDFLAAEDPEVDVVVVATGTDPRRPNFPPSDWLLGEGVTTPIILDDEVGSAAMAYGLPAYPMWVGIGSEGEVLFRISGGLTGDVMASMFEAVAVS